MALKIISGAGMAILMIASTAQAVDGKYLQNSDGQAVKNSVEETCVQAQYGSMPEGCEAAPAPVAAPAPAPTPRAHVLVAPKVKAKGNYKGKVQMDPASRATMQRYQK
ncbi:MAG: hypothetical protein HZT40_21865 [Candidatus Thiothrix singaporensis]|uniref:Uncharacterized protein n=1 Tax=Candidatus Thiothrix singaporensis TaxID=2799669 RepID=A0A7L6AXF0_9GAMM|nr:MAG: hypothetical protein HZT40_21865 [Candidatus Thiothrix singaporensis]